MTLFQFAHVLPEVCPPHTHTHTTTLPQPLHQPPAYPPFPARSTLTCGHQIKVDYAVKVEELLDVSDFCLHVDEGAAAPRYQLVGVVHHDGVLGGGHYTATVKNAMDHLWRVCNDAHVSSPIGVPSGPSKTAYLLFYRLVRWV